MSEIKLPPTDFDHYTWATKSHAEVDAMFRDYARAAVEQDRAGRVQPEPISGDELLEEIRAWHWEKRGMQLCAEDYQCIVDLLRGRIEGRANQFFGSYYQKRFDEAAAQQAQRRTMSRKQVKDLLHRMPSELRIDWYGAAWWAARETELHHGIGEQAQREGA